MGSLDAESTIGLARLVKTGPSRVGGLVVQILCCGNIAMNAI